VTGPDGRFRFEQVPVGHVTVGAWDGASGREGVDVRRDSVSRVDLALR
jgi:hypothetical protein